MMPREAALIFSIFIIALSCMIQVDGTAIQFTLPKDDVVICTDSLDNICNAPTSCNKNGKANLDSGTSLNVAPTTQSDNYWVIQGGYTIDFPSLCNVTCVGNCTCATCTVTEVDKLIVTDGVIPSTPTSSAATISSNAIIALLAIATMVVPIL